MTKKTLVSALLDHTTMRLREANQLAGMLIDAMSNDIAKGGLKLPGIGSFSLVERPARSGINPKTRKPYVSPARKAVRFKPSARLVLKVNDGQ